MKGRAIILVLSVAGLQVSAATEAYEPPPSTNSVSAPVEPARLEAAPPKSQAPAGRPKTPSDKVSEAAKAEIEKKAGLGKYRKIIDRAPFRNSLVPTAVAGAPTSNTPLKLNGIIRIGNRLLVGIEDAAQQRSMILSVGQSEQGIEVQSIDEASQTVTLTHNGAPATLVLEKPPVGGGGGSPPAPALLAGARSTPVIQPPGSTNAPPVPIRRRKNLIIPRTQ